jgi:hypothetical protein
MKACGPQLPVYQVSGPITTGAFSDSLKMRILCMHAYVISFRRPKPTQTPIGYFLNLKFRCLQELQHGEDLTLPGWYRPQASRKCDDS